MTLSSFLSNTPFPNTYSLWDSDTKYAHLSSLWTQNHTPDGIAPSFKIACFCWPGNENIHLSIHFSFFFRTYNLNQTKQNLTNTWLNYLSLNIWILDVFITKELNCLIIVKYQIISQEMWGKERLLPRSF